MAFHFAHLLATALAVTAPAQLEKQPEGGVDAIAVCAVPEGHPAGQGFFPVSYAEALEIELIATENGLDVQHGGAFGARWSLRGSGAQVSAPMVSDSFMHLMSQNSERSEQYIFKFSDDGQGELLWSSRAASGETVIARAECEILP